jgi:hypothetical protein
VLCGKAPSNCLAPFSFAQRVFSKAWNGTWGKVPDLFERCRLGITQVAPRTRRAWLSRVGRVGNSFRGALKKKTPFSSSVALPVARKSHLYSHIPFPFLPDGHPSSLLIYARSQFTFVDSAVSLPHCHTHLADVDNFILRHC